MKLGQWQENLQGVNETSIQTVLQYYNAATEHDKHWYKAWHSWAYMNFETVLFYKQMYAQQSAAESVKTNSVSSSLKFPLRMCVVLFSVAEKFFPFFFFSTSSILLYRRLMGSLNRSLCRTEIRCKILSDC
jgi:hypothetical protein